MYYDTQVIYGETNKSNFTLDGWIYYRTPKGRAKRKNGTRIESVTEKDFMILKEKFEHLLGYKVDC
jgi:hypothetical protein